MEITEESVLFSPRHETSIMVDLGNNGLKTVIDENGSN